VRRLAVAALGKLDHEGRVEPLLEAFKDSDPEVRKTAVLALKKLVNPRLTLGASWLIRDPDAVVRASAAHVLEAQGWVPNTPEDALWLDVARGNFANAAALGSAAVPALELVIDKGPYSLAVSAVRALGQIDDRRAARPLLNALKSSDMAVCVAAVDVLGRGGFEEAVDPLIELLNHTDSHVRLAAIEALGALNAARAAVPLSTLLRDPVWEVRREATEALGRLRDPQCLEPLTQCLADPDIDVREAAAIALANLGDARAIPALVSALADEASGVRRLAAAALSRIDENWASSHAAQPALEKLKTDLQHKDSYVRHFAEQLLGRVAQPRAGYPLANVPQAPPRLHRQKMAVTLLVSLLTAPDRDLRQAAVEALARVGEQRAESALVRALTDPDSGVRAAAEKALQTLRKATA
jgi:HEAT repeat protein